MDPPVSQDQFSRVRHKMGAKKDALSQRRKPSMARQKNAQSDKHLRVMVLVRHPALATAMATALVVAATAGAMMMQIPMPRNLTTMPRVPSPKSILGDATTASPRCRERRRKSRRRRRKTRCRYFLAAYPRSSGTRMSCWVAVDKQTGTGAMKSTTRKCRAAFSSTRGRMKLAGRGCSKSFLRRSLRVADVSWKKTSTTACSTNCTKSTALKSSSNASVRRRGTWKNRWLARTLEIHEKCSR
mmetsp:Transcript_14373/g.40898  ORF Transcript_14373/g.40898 Transcript_14373/m.40898 type:complete len:242 (+) Transcript_14373:135-860(+)